MQSDALVHVCHVKGSNAVRDLRSEVGDKLPGGAMVCGMAPDRAGDDVTLGLYQALPSSAHRAAFLPALSGFAIDSAGMAEYVAERDRQYPGLWRGIGEVFAHKSDPGWTPKVSPDAATVPLWDIAAQWDLPVWLHHDLRSNDDAASLERALRRHRDGPPVVLCHAGVPHKGDQHSMAWRLCERLMERNPRLVADLSWSALDHATRGDSSPLRRLVRTYTERVVLGSDAVGSAGVARDIDAARESFRRVLAGMGPEVASKVGTENFRRLLLR